MNKLHLAACAGPEWAETVRKHIIPWTTGGIDLGDHLLEIGAGPGATTDILMTIVPRLTAVEVDEALAEALLKRMADTNVTVVHADATELPFESGQFSAAICLTMLHHVPSTDAQDRLLAEMARAVRPGGVIIGTDSLDSPQFQAFHEGDVCCPLEPATVKPRLEGMGLTDIVVETNPYAFRFVARVP